MGINLGAGGSGNGNKQLDTETEKILRLISTCFLGDNLRQDQSDAGDDVERNQRTPSSPSVSHTQLSLVRIGWTFYASQSESEYISSKSGYKQWQLGK